MPHDTAHSAMLHTSTYLRFCKFEALGELQTFGDGQILVLLELCLQRLDLGRCEGRTWPFLALVLYRAQWERNGIAATARVRAAGCPAPSARRQRTLCNTVHKIAVACLPCYLNGGTFRHVTQGEGGDLGVDGWIILGWICGERGVYRVLVGKPEGKRPLGRPRRRWVDNIRMDL